MTRVARMLMLVVGVTIVAAGPLGIAALARAQEPAADDGAAQVPTKRRKGQGQTKFYDFDELLIGGEVRAPNAYFASARQRMRWTRLLRLRRSFVPVLMSTDKHPILRESLRK